MMGDGNRKKMAMLIVSGSKSSDSESSEDKKESKEEEQDHYKMGMYSAMDKFCKAVKYGDAKMASDAMNDWHDIRSDYEDSMESNSHDSEEY